MREHYVPTQAYHQGKDLWIFALAVFQDILLEFSDNSAIQPQNSHVEMPLCWQTLMTLRCHVEFTASCENKKVSLNDIYSSFRSNIVSFNNTGFYVLSNSNKKYVFFKPDDDPKPL